MDNSKPQHHLTASSLRVSPIGQFTPDQKTLLALVHFMKNEIVMQSNLLRRHPNDQELVKITTKRIESLSLEIGSVVLYFSSGFKSQDPKEFFDEVIKPLDHEERQVPSSGIKAFRYPYSVLYEKILRQHQEMAMNPDRHRRELCLD